MLITANQPFGEWGKIFPAEILQRRVIGNLLGQKRLQSPVLVLERPLTLRLRGRCNSCHGATH